MAKLHELLVEVKQARMRANETEIDKGSVASVLLPILLEPFATSKEDHQ